MEDGLEQGLAPGEIPGESRPEQKGARALVQKRRKKNKLQDARQVSARGIEESRLHDVAFLGGQAMSQHDKKHGGKGEDPQASDLEQTDENDLAREAEILADGDGG